MDHRCSFALRLPSVDLRKMGDRLGPGVFGNHEVVWCEIGHSPAVLCHNRINLNQVGRDANDAILVLLRLRLLRSNRNRKEERYKKAHESFALYFTASWHI
jgi:hypothetical protein